MKITINSEIIDIDENPNMATVKYKIPENGSYHPFDTSVDYPFYVEACGYSFLSADRNYFLNHSSNANINTFIPYGYKTVCTYERMLIINNGNVIWKRSNYAPFTFGDKKITELNYGFSIHSLYEIEYGLFRTSYHLSENYFKTSYETFKEAFELAINHSIQSPNNYFMISKTLECTNWH